MELERISKQDCVFSIERTDIVEETIEFMSRYDEKVYSSVKFADLQVKVQEKYTYLLFTLSEHLRTGYKYDFKIEAECSNGEIVCYVYEDHLMRGMKVVFFFILFTLHETLNRLQSKNLLWSL